MCYCPTPNLHLNLAFTGDCAFLLFPQKSHSVWFISILNYGDTENVLINHLLLVIPMSYPCYYTNLCPHKPHKHAHTPSLPSYFHVSVYISRDKESTVSKSSPFVWLRWALTRALFIRVLLLGKGFHCEGIGPCDWLGHNPTNSCSSIFLIHCPVITGPAAAKKNTHKGSASAERAGKPSAPPSNLSKQRSHQHWLLMHFLSLRRLFLFWIL